MTTVALDGVDPFSSAFQQDPFPYYAAMREASPAWHLPGLGPPLHHTLRRGDEDPPRYGDVLVGVRRDRQPAIEAAPGRAARGDSLAGLEFGRRPC